MSENDGTSQPDGADTAADAGSESPEEGAAAMETAEDAVVEKGEKSQEPR